MFLIPESILENLTCDNCKKYLSVSPVKVYANKHIYCGRCCEENDGGVISLYGNIVQRGLFKCINRYDGCNQLLSYSEVSSHEKNCKSELYGCPICHLVPKMSSLLLINHFKDRHKENVLRKFNISIDVNRLNNVDDKKYLYIKENLLFMIYVSLNNSHIVLNTFHIGNAKLSREITQRFILSSSDAKLEKHITEKRPCCVYEGKPVHEGFRIELKNNECSLNVEIDLDARRGQKLLLLPSTSTSTTSSILDETKHNIPMDSTDEQNNKFYLCEEFKQMFHQYALHFSESSLVNIKNDTLLKCCCFCGNKFHFFSENQTVYKCTRCSSSDCERYICSKCYSFGVTTCTNGNEYKNAEMETSIFKRIKYFCKWNCSETYFGWNLQKHEFSCAFQKDHLCPLENCEWIGKLSEMTIHVQSHEGTMFYKKHSFSLQFIRAKKNYSKMVIPVLGHFVNLSWEIENNRYQFFLSMKEPINKVLSAAISFNDGNVHIIDTSFFLDLKRQSSVLIIFNDPIIE